GRARMRVTWDDLPYPSIDTPVALFFGSGTLYNRDGREYLVKAFPVSVRFDRPADASSRAPARGSSPADPRVHLACYFPMPFFHSARLELTAGRGSTLTNIHWNIRYHPIGEPRSHVAYFHATYRDHPAPDPGQDLLLLDTKQVEGGGDWSGSFIG